MIYIHVPFCRSFCTYCGFYSEIACPGKDSAAVSDYCRDLIGEIGRRRDEIGKTLGFNSLYIGGGTPSVLPLDALSAIVDGLGYGPYEEFTIEVNPEDIVRGGRAYVKGLVDLGVNRVSMGVQSLDDAVLRKMNRRHDAATARKAFGLLRDAGVGNISLDLIFGGFGISPDMLDRSLDGFIEMRPEHVSAYQLSIEEGSALAAMVTSGGYSEMPEEQCLEQYTLIGSRLAAAGYDHYEISSWALPGCRAEHNSAYWKRLPYVGLGPGAHSLIGNCRSWNSENVSGWSAGEEQLGPDEEREENIMLGLRTSDGVEASLCDDSAVSRLLACGDLEMQGGKIRIPEDRFFVSDRIILELV